MTSKRELFKNSCLCVIVDKEVSRPGALIRIAEAAAKAGADIIQYRDKISDTLEMATIAKKIRRVVRRYKRTFLVNDRIEVALASGADGVHIGMGDLDPGLARVIGGKNFLIGTSASTLKRAKKICRRNADYIGVGPVFSTPIKNSKRAIRQSVLMDIGRLGLPVMAIGGINKSTAPRLSRNGCNHIAVIRAICSSRNPYTATKELKAIIR